MIVLDILVSKIIPLLLSQIATLYKLRKKVFCIYRQDLQKMSISSLLYEFFLTLWNSRHKVFLFSVQSTFTN